MATHGLPAWLFVPAAIQFGHDVAVTPTTWDAEAPLDRLGSAGP
jgi:hypothetical protein